LIVVSVVAWISAVPFAIEPTVTKALEALDLWAKVSVTILVADEDRIFRFVFD
jgi:hypothetical protein